MRHPACADDEYACVGGVRVNRPTPPELIETALEQGLEQFTPHTIATELELRRAIHTTRSQGYALLREHLALGSIAIAAPIFGPEGVAGALAVVTSLDRPSADLIPMLKAACRGIGRGLTATEHRRTWTERNAPL